MWYLCLTKIMCLIFSLHWHLDVEQITNSNKSNNHFLSTTLLSVEWHNYAEFLYIHLTNELSLESCLPLRIPKLWTLTVLVTEHPGQHAVWLLLCQRTPVKQRETQMFTRVGSGLLSIHMINSLFANETPLLHTLTPVDSFTHVHVQ